MNSSVAKIQYSVGASTADDFPLSPKKKKTCSSPPPFDPKHPTHKTLLLRWCEEHWVKTFRKALQSSNALHYHDCCSSFSRRAFSRLAGHPTLQSSPVHKIPSFKEVCSSTDLYHWLLGKLTDNHKRGLKVFFPAINRVHQEQQDEGPDDGQDEIEMLRKRFDAIDKMESKMNLELKSLKDENDRLSNSVKSWFVKYQDLLDKHEPPLPSMLATPLKKKHKHNVDVFDEIFN